VNWRVFELVRQGVLERVGKGKFTVGESSFYLPDISPEIFKVDKAIKKAFPFVSYCVWPEKWINEFSRHISKTGIILVDIERDSAESVYFTLKDYFKEVFYKPSRELLQDYIQGLENATVVRNLVSEAPIQTVNGVSTVTIEKLLVDIFCDMEFEYLQGREIGHIYENAFSRYSVNQTKLLRYAARKGKKDEIMRIIKQYNIPENLNGENTRSK